MKGKNTGADHTIRRMEHNGEGLEIGVWKGDTTMKFSKISKHVDAVDPWSVIPYKEGTEYDYGAYLNRYEQIVGSRDPDKFQQFYDNVYNNVCAKAKKAGNVTVHRMTSQEFFDANKKTFDWIYVDGDHSFEGCYYDLHQAWKIVRPGGFLIGDDYTNKDAVKKAVDTFLEDIGQTAQFYDNQFKLKKK